MYPIVIVITSSAPRIIGGAGDGIPNARQAKPNANASTIPISGFMAYSSPRAFSPVAKHGRL
jgi:hypothetical protein